MLGTLKYMAPEIVISLICKQYPIPRPATDIFSLGCVLYYIVAGMSPINGLSKHEIADHALAGTPYDLTWPDSFESTTFFRQLLGKCLCHGPDDRPQSSDVQK